MTPPPVNVNPKVIRFFKIARSLPMDLQMVLCNRTFGLSDEIITVSESDDALWSVKSALDRVKKSKANGEDRKSCVVM